MSAGYITGSEKLVRLTAFAAQRLNDLLRRNGKTSGALRVAVIGGGCSGLQYKMELIEAPGPKDIYIQSNGASLVVDPKSALFISGSEIDFSEDLQKGGFKVINPNATSHCSCGESFSA